MDKTAERIFLETLGILTAAIEELDPWMKGRPQQVAGMCVYLAQALRCPQEEVKLTYLAALLHDLGMLYLPRDMLGCSLNSGAHDRDDISEHPLLTERVLSSFSLLKDCLPLVRHHHEAFDGTGYPDRLRGTAIPLGARIIAVVEAYYELTLPRCAAALDDEAALEALSADGRFDPEVVAVLNLVVRRRSAPETVDEPVENDAGVASEQQLRARKTILEIVGRFQTGEVDLPVLPSLITRIQELIDSPVASVDDLTAVIEQDAVISGKLISVANSPVYRSTKKVSSLREAVTRLGHNETQLVVGTLASRSLYDFDEPLYHEVSQKLWEHSLATAFMSRLLALEIGLGAGERFYALGLMHDIGKVLLLHSAAELLKKARNSNFDPISVEDTLDAIRAHHNVFGSALLKRWHFTPIFSEVAELHDRRHLSEDSAIEIRVVALASAAANESGYGPREPDGLDLAEVAAEHGLNLEESVIRRVANEAARLMQASLDLL